MKTLRPFTFLVLTALTFLSPPDSVWAAPPEAFLSDADVDGQVSGSMSHSRAGLMTLQGLTGRNELTYGALPWVGLEGNWGDNYQRQDYYTFQGFVPWNLRPGTDYFFSEMGLTVTEQSRLAGNWGAGYAYYLSDWDRLLRTFGYGVVDGQYEKTRTGIGIVCENLGKYVDFRGEAFFVLSDSTDLVQRTLTGDTHFTGNELCIDGFGVRETAYHHLDYEIGGPLAYLGDYGISAYGKAYYLFNTQNDDDSVGYGVRGEWSITEDLTFNVNYTHDDVFNEATWFTVAMTTPDGAPRNIARPISVRERFSKSVVRDKRIRTNIEVEEFCLPLLNPKTGAPYVFAHVNPDLTDGSGNGTFENPFASIDMMTTNNNPNFNIIYVRPRTDGTATNLTVMEPDGVAVATTPLMLLPNQFLLGSTIDQTVDAVPQPLLPGTSFTIPALDPGVAAPLLMNGTGIANSIVYGSRGNLISGFTFDGAGIHNGIGLDYDSTLMGFMGLTPDGIGQDLHVRNNTFQNTVVGIDAPDLSDGIPSPLCSLLGHSSIWNNTFDSNGRAYDVMIDASNNDGAAAADPVDGTVLTLSILNNNITNNTDGGRVTANGVDPTMAPAVGFARVNLIGDEDQNGNGILDPGEDLNGDGMLTQRDLDGDGNPDPVVAGNVADGNTNYGMEFIAENGGQVFAQIGALPGFVQDPMAPMFFNLFTGNGEAGLRMEANSSDIMLAAGNPSLVRGSIIANDFSDPATNGDGLHLTANGDTNTLAFIDFGNSGGDFGLTGAPNNILDLYTGVIDQNLFNRQNDGFSGVLAFATDASADLHFTSNVFDATGSAIAGPGLNANLFSGANPNGNPNAQMVLLVGGTTAQANMFDGNRDAGAIFRVGGFIGNPPAATLRSFAQFTNNVFQNTTDNPATNNTNSPTGDGIIIDRQGGALLTAIVGDGITNFSNGNLFSNNEGSGVHIIGAGSDQQPANGNLVSFIYVNENMFDSNGEGIGVDLIADAVIQGVAIRNIINNSVNDGIRVNTLNNTAFGIPVQPTPGEDLNGDGVLQPWEDLNFDGMLQLAGPTVLSSLFDSNSINGFGGDGILLSAADGSYNNVRISGYQLSNPADPTSVIRTVIDGGLTGNDGISIEAGGTEMVQGGLNSLYTIQGVDVRNVTGNGIQVQGTAGTNIYNIGGPGLGQFVTLIGNADTDVGIDGLFANTTAGFNTFNINSLMANNNQGHGANFLHTGGGLAVNVTSSEFNLNDGTGFTADIQSAADTFSDQGSGGGVLGVDTLNENHSAVINIGTEDTAFISKTAGVNTITTINHVVDTVNENAAGNGDGILDPGEDLNGDGILNYGEDLNGNGTVAAAGDVYAGLGNMFNDNGLQGFFFQTFGNNGNAGSVFVVDDAPSTNIYQNIRLSDPESGIGDFINVSARLNFVGNQVNNNGTRFGNNVDGMVLQIGTNTRMSAFVDGNTFGGNVLDDFRTNIVVSADPPQSTENAVAGPPVLDLVTLDPVAYLDLAFGENFGVAGIPPLLSGANAPVGAGLGNIGEAINIDTVGNAASLVGRTETGVFGADTIKPTNRTAFGYFNVILTAPSDLDGPPQFFSQLINPIVPGPVENHFNNASVFYPSIVEPAFTPTINYINNALP